MRLTLKVGDRVRVVDAHRWMPGREGAIIEIQNRTGNRYVVRFDEPELGFYKQKLGEMPNLLRLGHIDLEIIE